ncbi:MAG: alpha/beta fold hydrolase [Sphingobacteriales bacterium]|nr:MAG: alpha/beta fold hydrolase [Sphingobacteriales bacterium]
MNRKIVFRWLKIFVLVYATIGILIYYLQDYILLHPEKLPADYKFSFSQPFKELNIPYNADSKMNIVQFKTTDSLIKGVVLYFHGNRENINRYAAISPLVTKHGYEIWMLDYPGFGKSTGKFAEQVVYDWALTFYKLARARFTPDSIIIYGRSLGSGIASQLASIRDCKRLILETPYYSMPSVFDSYIPLYPFNKIIHYQFPTWQYLQKVDAPVTIFHGEDDGVIPLRNSNKLKRYQKRGDEFISIEDGSHNDLFKFPEYQTKLDSVLNLP